jgi:hypothetical protein
MDKYKKTVLAVIALCVLALPVKAESEIETKVYYCQTTSNVGVGKNGVVNYDDEKFKFKVSRKEVRFGRGGQFDGYIVPMTHFKNLNYFDTYDDIANLHFNQGMFYYSLMSGTREEVLVVVARCDDF